MAAIIPKIPEKVPAKKEFKVFLFISQPKKEPAPCLLYTSPSPRDAHEARMPSSA